MCGFAGFANLDGAPADAGVAAAMARLVAHRGPDDRGQRVFSLRGQAVDCAVGFHRLKILDLSDQGHQPMATPTGDVILALNGEIYNAFDYKAELEAAGASFRSRSDAEIVLHLYERHGLDGMLDRLNGMFAMMIADLRRHQIHLVRDHFGIKPLYWTRVDSSILFASEAKAFLAHPGFTAAIDERHVDEQLAFRYVAGDASLLKGVHLLRPGHRIAITPDGMTTTRYASIPDVTDAGLTHEAAVDQLGQLLGAGVASQLISDVAVGCQLSGGVDSSLVTVLACQHASRGLATFSIVFNDEKFSEERWIAEAAAVAGASSHRFEFSDHDFLEPIERASWHMDQPISHPNSLGLWMLAQRARPHARVLLSGEGADEVFGGYARFTAPQIQSAEAAVRATQFQPDSKLARLRPGANLTGAIDRRLGIFSEGGGDHLSNWLKYEMQTFLVDVLMRQDKMMMAHGIENRVPFLDRRIVAFARTLNASHLLGDSGKAIVKSFAGRLFSPAFVDRAKAAFNLPLSQYFRGRRFGEVMEDALLPGMKRRGLVSDTAVRTLWRRSLSAPALTEVLWIPVALEVWAQQFVDGRRLAARL